MSTSSDLTCIDLFAGAGGLSLGLARAGFNVVLANELHEHPARTYRVNLLEPLEWGRMIEGDVSTSMSKSALEKHFDTWDIRRVDGIDLLAGGPPCQGFSTAGSKRREDPRNRLFEHYLRVIHVIRPRAILFENVPRFEHGYDGTFFRTLVNGLAECSYKWSSRVLQAPAFGVPQLRRRFFLVGFPKGSGLDPEEVFESLNSSTRRRRLTPRQTIGDLDFADYGENPDSYQLGPRGWFQKWARNDLPITRWRRKQGNSILYNHQISVHNPKVIARMKLVQARVYDFPDHLRTGKAHQRALRPDDPHPQFTVTSLPDDYIHWNQDRPRILSVRETARFQMFPDWFRFEGKRTTGTHLRRSEVPQYTQVANAVPPPIAQALGESLRGLL